MRHILAWVAALVVAASPALAHEGGVDAKGVVKALVADRITIDTRHGEKIFALTPDTEFVRGSKPVKREDLRLGERVVVHARARQGALEAVQVRAGPGKR